MNKPKPYTVILSLEPESCRGYATLWMSHVVAVDSSHAIDAAMNEAALCGLNDVLDCVVFDGHLSEARDT